ncbi:hypothetical protein ACFPN7_29585 [Amycolatopsis halotolerans]|uniref:hypothetical protein n=1 Tax=Amycolatopsis halotolerans TaxID=330083 RepID=UPI003610FD81
MNTALRSTSDQRVERRNHPVATLLIAVRRRECAAEAATHDADHTSRSITAVQAYS